jgi:hypothetical protein
MNNDDDLKSLNLAALCIMYINQNCRRRWKKVLYEISTRIRDHPQISDFKTVMNHFFNGGFSYDDKMHEYLMNCCDILKNNAFGELPTMPNFD